METAEKQVEGKRGWIMSVLEMPTTQGPSYPVFEWSYGSKDGIRGGELHAWIHGILVFEDRRPIDMPEGGWKFKSVEEALSKINEYGWGRPPHIDEVFQDVIEAKKKLAASTKEETEKIFQELREKWKALVTS